ncbi:hypothetical protein [Ruegeria sp. A3M17]|uniref:hypothetical protein n=1 Tax=Ruegeria sp. A3M17 TaxID=2267229 RepID=UPI000DEBC1C5|nr:hypothetical protein [Ruegeria sp. A3M17]RBW52428.1 hypothetical protein DS906_20955 [Ruegeria sp. A3M17]
MADLRDRGCSPGRAWTISERDFLTLMFGHAADAAFLRMCGNHIATAQRMSPQRSFKLLPTALSPTALSLRHSPTTQTRTLLPSGTSD